MADESLGDMRKAFEAARDTFKELLASRYGVDDWTWYRAIDAIAGKGRRLNDDTRQDAALAADTEVAAAHDEYLRLLHVFYRTRDGEHGVLGSAPANYAPSARTAGNPTGRY